MNFDVCSLDVTNLFRDKQAYVNNMMNAELIALGAMFIAADTALQEKFRGERFSHSDANIAAICTLVFQMRNSYSHHLVRPEWKVRQAHQKLLTINFSHLAKNQRSFSIDLSKINGTIIPAHFGGAENMLLLIFEIRSILAETTDGLVTLVEQSK